MRHRRQFRDRGGAGMGMGPFGGEGRRGRRGRGRPLAHGELRYALLRLIGDEPKHGYELIKAIEDRTAGAYAPSPGAVYPTLEMMLDLGWVEAREAEGKKVFSLTDTGRVALAEQAERIDAVIGKLDALGADEDGEAQDFRTAMRRLRRTLHERAMDETLTHEQHDAIVEILIETQKRVQAV